VITRVLVSAGTLVLTLVACAAEPEPTPLVPPAITAEAALNGLSLRAVAAAGTVASGEVIEITATLAPIGPEPLKLTGARGGLVGFSVTRLEDGLTTGPPGTRLDCKAYVLTQEEPMVVPFAKSGGFSPDDPNADFMEAYFGDPELILPPGTWRIDVRAVGHLGHECGGDALTDLSVALVVVVTPAK
jgi:hypothetical protein